MTFSIAKLRVLNALKSFALVIFRFPGCAVEVSVSRLGVHCCASGMICGAWIYQNQGADQILRSIV